MGPDTPARERSRLRCAPVTRPLRLFLFSPARTALCPSLCPRRLEVIQSATLGTIEQKPEPRGPAVRPRCLKPGGRPGTFSGSDRTLRVGLVAQEPSEGAAVGVLAGGEQRTKPLGPLPPHFAVSKPGPCSSRLTPTSEPPLKPMVLARLGRQLSTSSTVWRGRAARWPPINCAGVTAVLASPPPPSRRKDLPLSPSRPERQSTRHR